MHRKITRRDFLGTMGLMGVSATAIAMGLTACGGSEPTPPSSSSSSSAGSDDGAGSSSSSGSSDSSSSETTTDPSEVNWATTTMGDGTICITGYNAGGAVPTGSVVLPSEIDGVRVTRVRAEDNYSSHVYGLGPAITRITIPGTVTYVGRLNCKNLQEVVMQEGVEEISDTFYGCKKLSKVQLPSSLKVIGGSTFFECMSLETIRLPDNLSSIELCAFEKSGLKSIVIPESVKTMGIDAFSETALESAVVKTTELEMNMFRDCKMLKNVSLNEKTSTISKFAFKGCTSLSNIVLPLGLKKIEIAAFSGCTALEKIKFPDGLTEIPQEGFGDCEKLTSIYIPASTTKIMAYAFNNCNALKDVYYQASETEWKAVTVGVYNDAVLAATMHYNASEASF